MVAARWQKEPGKAEQEARFPEQESAGGQSIGIQRSRHAFHRKSKELGGRRRAEIGAAAKAGIKTSE